MKGWRKFSVVILYILAVTFIAFAVIYWKYDTLAGVGLYAGGMAAGVAAFVYGNVKEHQSKTQQ